MTRLDEPVLVNLTKVCHTQEEVDHWQERFAFLDSFGDLPEYQAMRDSLGEMHHKYYELMSHAKYAPVSPPDVTEDDRWLGYRLYEIKRRGYTSHQISSALANVFNL